MVKDAIPALIFLIMNSTVTEIITDALWALSYISDGDDERIDAILKADNNVPTKLVELVSTGTTALMAPAVRILGNFASGSEEQTQAVLDAGLLSIAHDILTSGKKTLRKEMCWLLSNIAAGTPKQVASLMNTKYLSETLINLAVEADWDTRKEAIWAVSNAIRMVCKDYDGVMVTQQDILVFLAGFNS
jgi:importin subunit alpha-6/7